VIYTAVTTLIRNEGLAAVTFRAVQAQVGLAPASLVQRYGSRDGMIDAAIHDAFDRLDAATDTAISAAGPGREGARGLLFNLSATAAGPGDLALLHLAFSRPALQTRASSWRQRLENALAERLGSDTDAAIGFAAWQGALLWSETTSCVSLRVLLDQLIPD
jgi:AcrR family transcriptional regulator